MSHAAPAHSHSSPPLRMGLAIPNSKLIMWLFLGTEIMFFTAFIGTYIVLRLGSPGWPTDPAVTHILVFWGGLNTFVLIFSSYLVVVAHEAMGQHDFKKAWTCMLWVLICGFIFLGIKAYEYSGKISHDILPGHIAEDDRQAMHKAVQELTGVLAARLDALAPEDALDKLAAVRQEADASPTAVSDPDRLAELKAALKLNDAASKLKDNVRAETITLHQFEERLTELRKDPQIGEFAQRVHDPHPILYGNLFASVYFLMTGFHALHVVIGMILWGIPLARGVAALQGWGDYVENSGLYWHFVDLVWIFLFPLIYIV